jgi:CheY-like chemotaxis protein
MENDKSILLVEDNPDDIFFMEYALKKAEVHAPLRVVRDGQEAIDYLSGAGKFSDRKKFPLPCLVLLDLKLPVRDGLEVLQWIRQQPGLKTLIVTVLTTSKETRDVEQAYLNGANSFLVKPPRPDTLVEMMKAMKGYWLTFNQFPEDAAL